MGRPSGVLQGFMVHCIIVVVYSADCCGSVALLCSRIIADSCLFVAFVLFQELLSIIVYTIMTARSTRNSQAAAFDAIVSVAETTRPRPNDANLPPSTSQTPVVPSTSQAQPADQPSPAFLASVINAVKQALAAEQASNLPLTPPVSSSTSVPEAAMPGGVPPSSLSSGQLDAQVSALAASGVGFPPVSAVAASATAQGRPNFVVPSFVSTFASPIPALATSSSNSAIGTASLALGGVSLPAQSPILHQAFVVGPGFSPIPAKLVSQIVAGKFVELNKLLSVNIVSTESEPQLLLNGRLVLTSPKKPKRHIEDISSWLEAFSVYSLILSSHFPQRWRDLLQYQLLILRTYHQFAGRV